MRRQITALFLAGLLLAAVPVAFAAKEGDCAATATKVDALSSKVSNDMRRIRRELIALRTQVEKPGLDEAVAGLGYICGLFGVAFFVAGRRKKG
jgi:nickel transport protein